MPRYSATARRTPCRRSINRDVMRSIEVDVMRDLIEAQAHVVTGAIKELRRDKFCGINGECGTGKTIHGLSDCPRARQWQTVPSDCHGASALGHQVGTGDRGNDPRCRDHDTQEVSRRDTLVSDPISPPPPNGS